MLLKALCQKLCNIALSIKELFISIWKDYPYNNVDQIVDNSRWELSFIDDFEGNEIDESVWMTHYYWGTVIAKVELQKQTYVNSTLSVSDSCLYINPENTPTVGWYYKDGKIIRDTYRISSGMIHSGDSFKQKYGIFSIRCKLPKGKGLLPSAWLLDKQSWPPKLDIFDFDGETPNKIDFGLEWGLDIEKFFFNYKKTLKTLNLDDDFHIFTCKWEPNRVTWYIDNRLVAIYFGSGIPQTPMYLVINLALSANGKDYSNMVVDWVKVWKIRTDRK